MPGAPLLGLIFRPDRTVQRDLTWWPAGTKYPLTHEARNLPFFPQEGLKAGIQCPLVIPACFWPEPKALVTTLDPGLKLAGVTY